MPEPYFQSGNITLYCGDNREVLPALDVAVSAVVTDPPYDLTQRANTTYKSAFPGRYDEHKPVGGFMGMRWDGTGIAFDPDFWAAVLDAMLPGAHLVAFGGSRTFHRMGVAIEDAGLEIRDTLMWLYGSGFPKSLDVGKAIDKAAGAEREVLGGSPYNARRPNPPVSELYAQAGHKANITAPATDAARQWDGWGTALKPAYEPIILARKPFPSTVAANVLQHGTGALNIGASRVEGQPRATGTTRPIDAVSGEHGRYGLDSRMDRQREYDANLPAGRWPPNCLLDPTAAQLLDAMSGERGGRGGTTVSDKSGYFGLLKPVANDAKTVYRDTGGSSRFFPVLPVDDPDTLRFIYSAKSSRAERNAGLEGMPERMAGGLNVTVHGDTRVGRVRSDGAIQHASQPIQANHHPTVKPLAVMRWLLTLVTPPNGLILDPFAGSGTTGVAAAQLGFPCILIEQSEEYCEIAARRIEHALAEREAGKRWGNGTDPSRAGGFEKHTTASKGIQGKHGIYGTANGNLAAQQAREAEGVNPRYDPKGRWPSNVLLDRAAADVLDEQSGERKSGGKAGTTYTTGAMPSEGWGNIGKGGSGRCISDTGGASRFMTVLDDDPAPAPPAIVQSKLEGVAD